MENNAHHKKNRRGSSPSFHEPEFDFKDFIPDRVFTRAEMKGLQSKQDQESPLEIQPLMPQDKPPAELPDHQSDSERQSTDGEAPRQNQTDENRWQASSTESFWRDEGGESG